VTSSTSERRIRRFIESRSYSYSGFDSSEKLLDDLIRWALYPLTIRLQPLQSRAL
jgi:hypothetical protein